MNARWVIGFVLFVYSIGLSQVNAHLSKSPNKVDGEVILSVDLSRSKKKELQYAFELRNNGSKAVYYAANPQEVGGELGP